jgi:hypothetical protein
MVRRQAELATVPSIESTGLAIEDIEGPTVQPVVAVQAQFVRLMWKNAVIQRQRKYSASLQFDGYCLMTLDTRRPVIDDELDLAFCGTSFPAGSSQLLFSSGPRPAQAASSMIKELSMQPSEFAWHSEPRSQAVDSRGHLAANCPQACSEAALWGHAPTLTCGT